MPVSEKNTNKNPWAVTLYDQSLLYSRLGTNKGTTGLEVQPHSPRRKKRAEKKEPEKYYRHIASDTF